MTSPATAADADQVALAARQRVRATQLGARILLYVVLSAGALIVIAPFIWMVSTSLAPGAEVFNWPPRLIPSDIVFANYTEALFDYEFEIYFWNSLVVAIVATVSVLLFDSLAGYAFAKLRFRGSGPLFALILGTVMIPMQITMIPLFIIFRHIPFAGGNDWMGAGGNGFIDTYAGLIVPWLATTFGTYLMREFFRMLPSELIDAARIDGLSEFQIFWRVYLPLAKPALAAVGVLTFTEVWNTFLWPLIVVSDTEMWTVQLGLSGMKGQYFTEWHLLMAATVISCLPVFVVYLLGQRYFVQGIALSGLKG